VKKTFPILVYLCLSWNLTLVVGVALNAAYSRERAAGGQFEQFPTVVRVLYVMLSAIVLYQLYIFDRFHRKHGSAKTWILKVFCGLGLLSTLLNLISSSKLERWNAIPAFIITFAFYTQIKHRVRSTL
jgi:hypothetical protein